MDYEGRKEAFRTLVGSHNYNLNGENSDKDYKVFVLPTFDDLYMSNQYSKAIIGKTEDYEYHDIRKVSNLWWKANVNFLEVLFSRDGRYGMSLSPAVKMHMSSIFQRRDEIAQMNLPYLYDACVGMHLTKRNQVDKGTQGTQHLVEQFGYDTKQALHSLRILDFLNRFAATGFKDFKRAIWYDKNDSRREFLLSVKAGTYSKEEYLDISNLTLKETELQFKDVYKAEKPKEELNKFLIDTVKEIVRLELFAAK